MPAATARPCPPWGRGTVAPSDIGDRGLGPLIGGLSRQQRAQLRGEPRGQRRKVSRGTGAAAAPGGRALKPRRGAGLGEAGGTTPGPRRAERGTSGPGAARAGRGAQAAAPSCRKRAARRSGVLFFKDRWHGT